MKILVVAVGVRLPSWMEEGVEEYAKRLGRSFRLLTVPSESAKNGKAPSELMAKEAEKLQRAAEAHQKGGSYWLALSERGQNLDTVQFADALARWQREGQLLTFFIGGHHGLHPTLLARCKEQVRLSSLTLPHGLARVVCVEALYRAQTLLQGHPYHRQ